MNIYFSNNDNWGDGISLDFFQKLCKTTLNPIPYGVEQKDCYLTTGSIFRMCTRSSIIFGTGCISIDDDIGKGDWCFTNKVYNPPSSIISVRGPKTRAKLLEMGIDCPEVYGDPLFIAPLVYKDVAYNVNYTVGIIPHFIDKHLVSKLKEKLESRNETVNVIDIFTASNPEHLLKEISKCEKIVSSSLHGVLSGISCGKPTIFTEFSDKVIGKRFKFYDFFESLGVYDYNCLQWDDDNILSNTIPVDKKNIYELGKSIIKACPFFESDTVREQRLNEWKNLKRYLK